MIKAMIGLLAVAEGKFMLDLIIEKHYKAYLQHYAEMNEEQTHVEQEVLKDLYAIKYGEHPDNADSDISRYMAFWEELGEIYGN